MMKQTVQVARFRARTQPFICSLSSPASNSRSTLSHPFIFAVTPLSSRFLPTHFLHSRCLISLRSFSSISYYSSPSPSSSSSSSSSSSPSSDLDSHDDFKPVIKKTISTSPAGLPSSSSDSSTDPVSNADSDSNSDSAGSLSLIKEDISGHPVFLYMKGTPDSPRCGFSANVVKILKHLGAEFSARDVLADEEIRNAVKQYSDWPTLPQLYVKGEFVGGSDIVTSLFKNGELEKLLTEAGAIKRTTQT